MGSRQRQRAGVVQTYGRNKRRVVTVDPWSSGENKHHLFSSFSSDDSSLIHNTSDRSNLGSNNRQNGRISKKKPKATVATYNISDSSNTSSSSSVNNSNGSDQLFSARDQRSSSRVLRDKTNTADKHKSRPVDKKRKPPLLKKGDSNKKAINIKKRKVTEKKRGDPINTTCRSDASSDGGAPSQYNFSDLDKYSLIMSDSPVVEHDVSRDRLEAATSLVQTSTPHVGRPSSARLQSVGKDLSIAAGSPISSPAVDSPQVDCSAGGIDDALHVADMSSIACERSKDFSQLSLADSFVAEIPTGVSLRRRQKDAPIMRLVASQHSGTFQSEFDASHSLFDDSTHHELPTAKIREKLEQFREGQLRNNSFKHGQRMPVVSEAVEAIEVSSDTSEYLTAHQDCSVDSGSDSENEIAEETEEQLSDIEEGEEESEEEDEEEEDWEYEEEEDWEDEEEEDCEDEEEQETEDSCTNCSTEPSSRKSSLNSEPSEVDVTRYMLTEDCDISNVSNCEPCSDSSRSIDSEASSSSAASEITSDSVHSEQCASNSQTNSLHDSPPVAQTEDSSHKTPVTRRILNNITNSDKRCFSPMLLLTPIRLHKSGRLATDREKVLYECDQEMPHSFSDCLTPRMMRSCVKIGEGTFGEVFKARKNSESVALKVIPIEGSQLVNDEVQKTFNGILTEIVISKQLSALREDPDNATESFVCVNDVSLVQGSYPDNLLKQWDLFKNSENDRPDYFDKTQLFIVFEFEECGCAVESFKFTSLNEAKSVLHQVTCALAVAESALQFEHRDLHVGNVLVKRTSQRTVNYVLHGEEHTLKTYGVKVAIIDFTLSRLTQEGVRVHTNLGEDEELFQGHGDYQFDIYRLMREENGDEWAKFTPMTNVLWIHYLAQKLNGIKYPKAYQKLSRELRNFQREALDYCSALHILKQCPLFNKDS